MLIALTSDTNLGATFLDWSVHWLSGQTTHYNITANKHCTICVDPLINDNAHGHQKNHSLGLEQLVRLIEKLHNNPQTFVSVYSGLTEPDSIPNIKANDWHKVEQFHAMEFKKIWAYTGKHFDKHIHIADDPSIALYHLQPRVDSSWMLRLGQGLPISEAYQEIFFSDSLKNWQKLGLTHLWDIRERLALDIRPFKVHTPVQLADYTQPHLWINCLELWCLGEDVVGKVFEYLGMKINKQRFDKWINTYRTWQHKQLTHARRSWQIPHIVEATVKNYYYELPKLTLLEEAVIQHCLIYQHNLNLKTWQLTNFPDNTQKLHLLLEENCHPVDKIY